MLMTRFPIGWLIIAICLCCAVKHAQADAPKTALSVSKTVPSDLHGVWRDAEGLLLPPGITPFEVFRDTITFAPGGSFTQVLEKAGGPLRQIGTYQRQGNRLTLNFSSGPLRYEFSCHNNRLTLKPIGFGKAEMLTMARVNPVTAQMPKR